MTLIIPFDWDKPPLSLNDRPPHWARRGAEVRAVRDLAAKLCTEHLAGSTFYVLEPIVVTLVWYAPTRGKRDTDNPVATLKPICDGLVDAGLVPDDTPEWMDKRPVRIVYRKGEPGVELHIETRAEVVERAALAAAQHFGIVSPSNGKPAVNDELRELARVMLDAGGWFASLPPSV